jgi:N-acetylglucosamine-6-sulfatase
MQMKNLLWLLLLVAPLAWAQKPAPAPNLALAKIPGAKPRNIIFIFSDDHRHDFMGFTGRVPWLQTPHLDRLAREGAHCQNAFVTTSLCSPSRATILTGQYAHEHTVVDNFSPEPANLTYFPQYLQRAGYQTALFGKWHMGDEDDRPRKGFDTWVSFRGQGQYFNPTLNLNGQTKKFENGAYTPEVLTDLALEFLAKRDPNRPFFAYISHKSVHADFRPAPADLYKYHGKPIPYPASRFFTHAQAPSQPGVNLADVPQWVKNQRFSWHGIDYAYHGTLSMDTIFWRYCETLHSLDASIGRVLKYLDDNGLAESTLVVYASDNGFYFGEHGFIDKRSMYEESMRIPLLVRCPELVKPGTKMPQVVQNIDLPSTFLAAAGLQPPPQMRGQSFLPLLAQKETPWRDKIFYEYYWEHDFPQTPTMFGVRTDRYKYVFYHGLWDVNELYDLQADPQELNNLIRSPQHQAIAKELQKEVFDWLERTNGLQIPLKRPLRRRGDHRYKDTY